MKQKFVAVIFLAIFVFLPIGANQASMAVDIEAQVVEYPLPHPGLLPDSPIYFLKNIRDQMLIFFTRDNIKKAEIFLLLSDKKINMAKIMSSKGKWRQAVLSASESENHAEAAFENVEIGKKQGLAPSTGFTHNFKLSTEKHQEVLEDLLKTAPEGERARLEEVLKQNRATNRKVSKL